MQFQKEVDMKPTCYPPLHFISKASRYLNLWFFVPEAPITGTNQSSNIRLLHKFQKTEV